MSHSEGITRLLVQWSGGDEQALEQLTALVYDELRRLAASYLRGQRPDHTLQATALVHETYLELLDLRHIGMVQGDAVVVVACVRIVTLWGAVIVGLPLLLALLRTTRR